MVPFLVEDELMSLGATFSKVNNWGVHTVADGQLITGQNRASSPFPNLDAVPVGVAVIALEVDDMDVLHIALW